MAKQKSNNKCHDKLKKLLESIKPCIMTYANDDDIKILLRNFMDEQFQLCHDYFQYHLDEAKAIAIEYQTHLAYIADLMNTIVHRDLHGFYTEENYTDYYYLQHDACCNIETFNLMFGFIDQIRMDKIIKDLGHDYSPIFQEPQANEVIAKDSDPEFSEKLINLLDSIKAWNKTAELVEKFRKLYLDNYKYHLERDLKAKTEKFMDELWPLYLDYFQYHLEEARIASIDHQELLSNNIAIINDMYVDSQFHQVENETSNEYLDPPWEFACEIRSKIEAFNDMFGFLGTLDSIEFAEWLVNYKNEAQFADVTCDAPPKHWWWHLIKLVSIRKLRKYDFSTLDTDNLSIENHPKSIILDKFGNNIIKTEN